jgi:hypothetical protein
MLMTKPSKHVGICHSGKQLTVRLEIGQDFTLQHAPEAPSSQPVFLSLPEKMIETGFYETLGIDKTASHEDSER